VSEPRTPSYCVDEDYPAGPEIHQPLPEWSNRRGLESSTLETDVYIWHYALLVLHVRIEEFYTALQSCSVWNGYLSTCDKCNGWQRGCQVPCVRYVRYASNIWNAKYAHTATDRSHTVVNRPRMSLSPAKQSQVTTVLWCMTSSYHRIMPWHATDFAERHCQFRYTASHLLQNPDNQIWKTRISISTKLKLYNTCILSIFLYSSECRAVSKRDELKIDALCLATLHECQMKHMPEDLNRFPLAELEEITCDRDELFDIQCELDLYVENCTICISLLLGYDDSAASTVLNQSQVITTTNGKQERSIGGWKRAIRRQSGWVHLSLKREDNTKVNTFSKNK